MGAHPPPPGGALPLRPAAACLTRLGSPPPPTRPGIALLACRRHAAAHAALVIFDSLKKIPLKCPMPLLLPLVAVDRLPVHRRVALLRVGLLVPGAAGHHLHRRGHHHRRRNVASPVARVELQLRKHDESKYLRVRSSDHMSPHSYGMRLHRERSKSSLATQAQMTKSRQRPSLISTSSHLVLRLVAGADCAVAQVRSAREQRPELLERRVPLRDAHNPWSPTSGASNLQANWRAMVRKTRVRAVRSPAQRKMQASSSMQMRKPMRQLSHCWGCQAKGQRVR